MNLPVNPDNYNGERVVGCLLLLAAGVILIGLAGLVIYFWP